MKDVLNEPSGEKAMGNSQLHDYAQTNIQLYDQLLSGGYSNEDVRCVRDAYALAAVLFSGRFQPSGKTFISHVVGTASILASVRADADLVCAGLLHNVYNNGEFGSRKSGISKRKRSELKSVVGATVESYVTAFFTLPWSQEGIVSCGNNLAALDVFERGALLIRTADELEKLLDLEALYYHADYYIDNAPVYVEISKRLGVTALGENIVKALEQCQSNEIPSPLCYQASKNVAEVVVPPSYRLRVCGPLGYRAGDWVCEAPPIAYDRLKRLYWKSARSFNRSADAVRRKWLVSRRGCLEIRAKECATLFLDAKLERIATGFQFIEGPVWIAEDNSLLFSDIPANRILKLTPAGHVQVFREPSGNSNGLTLDKQGRLVACEHSNRRVTRTEKNGAVTVLADRYQGKKLNSPNDVIVKSDGAIYFTDPSYGIKPQEQEQPTEGVYRLSPDHKHLALLAGDFARPNGLAFSPDEKQLYIDDSARRHIRVFDVQDDGFVSNGRILHDMDVGTPGAPDGMKVDINGNIYCAGAGGVWVFSPQGKHLGTIVTPEKPSNCAWGDRDWRSLYITAETSVYRIRVRAPGVPVPRRTVPAGVADQNSFQAETVSPPQRVS